MDDSDENKPPPKRPWWVIGATLKNSRNSAIWYSVIFVLYGAVVIGSGTRNPWTVALCVLWGILAAWAWLGVRYFVRNGEHSDSEDRR